MIHKVQIRIEILGPDGSTWVDQSFESIVDTPEESEAFGTEAAEYAERFMRGFNTHEFS